MIIKHRSLYCLLLTILFIFQSVLVVFAADEAYINEDWDKELSVTLSEACDWISDTDDILLQFCLGTAGKTAPSGTVNSMIRRIAACDPSELDLYTLLYDILNVTFSGYHAANIMGVNLIDQLTKRSEFTSAELHLVAYGILAIDSNPYEVSSAFRNAPQKLVERLLQYQNSDGGFRTSYLKADSSITQTALALTALSSHQDMSGVSSSIQRSLAYLSANQQWDGSFLEQGSPNSIAVSKVIIALRSLNISLTDERFYKNNTSLIEILMNYVRVDGGFSVLLDEESDATATENAILALSAIRKGKSPYLMDTPLSESTYVETTQTVIVDTAETFDWTVPFFFGIYVLFLLLILIYLIVSRMHPLLYWENYVKQKSESSKPKFPIPPTSYQPFDDETQKDRP